MYIFVCLKYKTLSPRKVRNTIYIVSDNVFHKHIVVCLMLGSLEYHKFKYSLS